MKRNQAGISNPSGDRLTSQQESFARLVALHGLKASVAYRKAYNCSGSMPETVWSEASRLLSDPKVAARVAELRAIAASKLEVTIERIAAELARIGFLDAGELYDDTGNLIPIPELPEDVRRAISRIEVNEIKTDESVVGYTKKVWFNSKQPALETMAKWKGMLIERHMDVKDPFEGFSNKDLKEFLGLLRALPSAADGAPAPEPSPPTTTH